MTEEVMQQASTMAQALRQAMESLTGPQRQPAIQRWIWSKYPDKWKVGTLQGHLNGCCVNNPKGIKNHPTFPRFLYFRGSGEYELYDKAKHGTFDEFGRPEGQEPESDSSIDEIGQRIAAEIEERSSAEFAYEAHLRDYLARNLTLLESGLSLWTGSESDSVEFGIDGRRIDILAKDKDGIPVVIELKLSRGHDRTLGQALYYRGRLKQILAVSKVRIIMVAGEVTDELRIASGEVSDVELFTYTLIMQVQRVSNLASGSSDGSAS